MDLFARLLWGAAIASVVLVLTTAAQKLLSLLLRCHRAKRQWLSSPIPGPPLSSKLLGHVSDLVGPKGSWSLLQWTNRYGCIYKLQLLDTFTVVLTDPGTIARITRKSGPGPYLPKSHKVYEVVEIETRPRRHNIMTDVEEVYWKAIRQAAAPCFSMSNLKQVVPLVLSITQRAVNHIAGQELVDVSDAAKRITSDIMGYLLHDEDLKGTCWEPSEYVEALYHVKKAEAALLVNPFHLWHCGTLRCGCSAALTKHDELIGQKVTRMRQQPPAPHTIAAHILQAIDPTTGQPIDDSRAKAEISSFMGAGFETSSHAITWCLTLLAAHPAVQEQVFVELQAAGLAPKGGDSRSSPQDFQASDLARLPLLSAVIKEALRVCAPVPYGLSRQVVMEEGAELCGYHVPKGTNVMIALLPYGLACHLYGADALSFRPERWLTVASKPSGAQQVSDGGSLGASPTADAAGKERGAPPDPLTFLTGQRDCIGQNLAKLEMQVVLATLLSCFKISPGPELQQELDLAAATGQGPVEAVHALAGNFITLQPLSGRMMLKLAARGS